MIILAKNKNEFLETLITIATNGIADQKNITQDIIFYPVLEVLFLVIAAMLSGEENFEAIVNFGVKHSSLLKKYLPFQNKIPKNIIAKLFVLIDIKRCDIWLRNCNNVLLYKLNSSNGHTIEKHTEDIACLTDCRSILLTSSNPAKPKYSIINYISLADHAIVANNISDNVVEFTLTSTSEQNNYQIANNMLILRNMVLDIIKKHKIKKCSKLGINAIRRLAHNNQMMLIDILDNWIYNNNMIIC